MNKSIEKALLKNIADTRAFLQVKSLRESIEDWRASKLNNIAEIKSQNNPENDWVIEHNTAYMDRMYNAFQISLKNESEHTQVLDNVIGQFDQLSSLQFVSSLKTQILEQLPQLKPKDGYDTFHGFLFEYDSEPLFHLITFKADNLEVIIDPPKYIEFGNVSYSTSAIPSIDFSEIAKPVFSEEYENVIWEYENELEYFTRIKEMYISYVQLCLHRTLAQPVVSEVMNDLPISKQAIFYSGQHDSEIRTIYVREA